MSVAAVLVSDAARAAAAAAAAKVANRVRAHSGRAVIGRYVLVTADHWLSCEAVDCIGRLLGEIFPPPRGFK